MKKVAILTLVVFLTIPTFVFGVNGANVPEVYRQESSQVPVPETTLLGDAGGGFQTLSMPIEVAGI